MSRKVIKRKKMKPFAKHMCLTSVATPSTLDPTTLQSAGSLPLVLDIVVKTGKNTTGRFTTKLARLMGLGKRQGKSESRRETYFYAVLLLFL